MNREDIKAKLKEIVKMIKPNTELGTLTDDTQLVRDLGLDSLTILLLALAIEKEYSFHFEGSPQFTTVGEVITFIEKHV